MKILKLILATSLLLSVIVGRATENEGTACDAVSTTSQKKDVASTDSSGPESSGQATSGF